MSVFERAAAALSTLGVPYANQIYRTATGADLPDVFITYNLISSVGVSHADDVEKLRRQRVQVSVWSRDGLTSLPDVDGAMTAAGFARAEKRQLPFDQESGHFGLALDYVETEDQDA